MYVQTTAIQRQLKTGKVSASKLVEEVGNCFWEVAQLAMLFKSYLVSAYHLLPQQCSPADIVATSTSKIVGDLTPQHSTGPDIPADAQTLAFVLNFAQPPA
jgi:hypothetical protein